MNYFELRPKRLLSMTLPNGLLMFLPLRLLQTLLNPFIHHWRKHERYTLGFR